MADEVMEGTKFRGGIRGVIKKVLSIILLSNIELALPLSFDTLSYSLIKTMLAESVIMISNLYITLFCLMSRDNLYITRYTISK